MISYIFVWLILYLYPGSATTDASTILRRAIEGHSYPEEVTDPLEQLVNVVKFVNANKPKEIKDEFSKAPCEDKLQYRDYLKVADAGSPMRLKVSSMMSLILVSMYGCPVAQVYAARMRILCSYGNSPRVRDITEVMVSVSESPELHEAFIHQYEAPTRGGSWELKYSLEHMRAIGLDDDIENVCFELKNRVRRPIGSAPINVQQAAKDLKDEMKKWDNRRQRLDAAMMETPFDQLRQLLDEFRKLNDGKLIKDIFADKFKDDEHKLNVYTQLAELAVDKEVYTAIEIHDRLTANIEGSLSLAHTLVVLGTLTKQERDKTEVEYKKIFNIGLYEQIEQMIPKMGLDGVVLETLKLYLEDERKKC